MAPPRKTPAQYEQEARRVGKCLVHPSSVARRVYQLRHGQLETKQYVCHTCDNTYCIEDSHHFIGSCRDNVLDAVRKGRHSSFRKGGVRFSGTHTDGVKAVISRTSKERWANPEYKARVTASIRRNHPANREKVNGQSTKSSGSRF